MEVTAEMEVGVSPRPLMVLAFAVQGLAVGGLGVAQAVGEGEAMRVRVATVEMYSLWAQRLLYNSRNILRFVKLVAFLDNLANPARKDLLVRRGGAALFMHPATAGERATLEALQIPKTMGLGSQGRKERGDCAQALRETTQTFSS